MLGSQCLHGTTVTTSDMLFIISQTHPPQVADKYAANPYTPRRKPSLQSCSRILEPDWEALPGFSVLD